MMTTETVQDLGRIPAFDPDAPKTKPVEKPAAIGYATGPIFMPRKLRFLNYDTSKTPAQMEAEYLTWRIKILKPCSLGYGRFAEPGQTCEISGDVAAMLVLNGQAEWNDDPKVNAELAQIEEARRLGISVKDFQKLDLKKTPEKPKSWAMS